jgi:hypothetical protein
MALGRQHMRTLAYRVYGITRLNAGRCDHRVCQNGRCLLSKNQNRRYRGMKSCSVSNCMPYQAYRVGFRVVDGRETGALSQLLAQQRFMPVATRTHLARRSTSSRTPAVSYPYTTRC